LGKEEADQDSERGKKKKGETKREKSEGGRGGVGEKGGEIEKGTRVCVSPYGEAGKKEGKCEDVVRERGEEKRRCLEDEGAGTG